MQVIVIPAGAGRCRRNLVEAHHRLRARVFSDRLGWDVKIADGLEIDGFDALDPVYVLALGPSDRVVGCARLLPATGPTMLADVFPSLLPEGGWHPHAAMVESSRFCVDTIGQQDRPGNFLHEATLIMLSGIVDWCLRTGMREIVTVTDLRFERILARAGWPMLRIGAPKQIGVTMAVAGILPVGTAILEKLRPMSYRFQIASATMAA